MPAANNRRLWPTAMPERPKPFEITKGIVPDARQNCRRTGNNVSKKYSGKACRRTRAGSLPNRLKIPRRQTSSLSAKAKGLGNILDSQIAMKTLPSLLMLFGFVSVASAQGPVMIGGGSTKPRPVVYSHGGGRTVLTRVVFRQEINPLNPYASTSLNAGAEEPYITEIVTSVGSSTLPLICRRSYDCLEVVPSHRDQCSRTSPVIYLGRNHACQRNYSFTYRR